MGGKRSGPTAEEKELQRLQNERLQEEQAAAERLKKEQQALLKAKRSGGLGGLLQGTEEGEKGGYKRLLGG